MRISAARDMVDFVDKFQPGARREVLSRFPPASLQAFETIPRMGWLPIEHDHWVVDGIVDVLGRDRARQCWTSSVQDHVDKPLLRSMVSGVLYLSPQSTAIFKILAHAWGALYRDFCTVRVAKGPHGSVEVIFENIAPEVRTYPNYLTAWHGICQGAARLGRLTQPVIFTIAADMRSAVATF